MKDQPPDGPWIDYHKQNRHTSFISDRSTFPLRSLIPETMDGLLGAQGNVGFSSIVSAAIRLHNQRIHIGQASGATAAVSLRENIDPRDIPYSRRHLEAVRHALCGEVPHAAPLLLWGYRDLPADHPAFVAINRLAALGILPGDSLEVDFKPDESATQEWAGKVLRRSGIPALAVDHPLESRGNFCQRIWSIVQRGGWSALEFSRQSPDDADIDGIPDTEDALLFTPNKPIQFQIRV